MNSAKNDSGYNSFNLNSSNDNNDDKKVSATINYSEQIIFKNIKNFGIWMPAKLSFKHKKTTTWEAAQMTSYTVNVALGLDSDIDAYDEIKILLQQVEKNTANVFLVVEKLKKATIPTTTECKGFYNLNQNFVIKPPF